MAALDFPNSPATGQQFQAPTGVMYQYATPGRWVTPVASLTSQMSAEDNLIANGGMEVWQRGTSGFTSVGATTTRTADRWAVYADTGATVNVARQAQVPADVGRRAALMLQRTVAGSGNTTLSQAIEGVRTGEGQAVTVSFEISSTGATSGLWVQFNNVFGTGGAPSSTVAAAVGPTFSTVGTVWERKTFTLSLPNLIGKTIGTNGDDNLQLLFVIPASAGATTWYLSNVDIRLGSVAPAQFLRRPQQEELALCQRYFQSRASWATVLYGPTSAYAESSPVEFPVAMRAAPTVVTSSITYNNASGLTMLTSNTAGIRYAMTVTSNGNATAYFNFTADAEL